MTILIVGMVFNNWFWTSKKRKYSPLSHPIPLWRRWWPRNPSHCGCCRAETQISEPVPRQLAVWAWSLQRSKRGRKKSIDSSGHFCPNPDCQYHENRDAKTHALVSNGQHGHQGIRQWVCQACGTYVSERNDTAMSNLKKRPDDVARTREMLNRGISQADVAAHHEHTPRTVRRWLKRVAIQSLRIHDHYFRNLELGNVQPDELVGLVKGATRRHFIWTAMDATTKIIPVWHVGGRKLQDAQLVIHQLKSRLKIDHIPIFTSDHLRHYFSSLCSHFGEYRRELGHRNLVWRVSSKLLCAMLIKVRSGKRLRYTITLPIFGTRGQIRDALPALGLSGKIQTAFVERGNLTFRNLIAALHRRTWALPWSTTTLNDRLAWLVCFYHFCRPHMSLANTAIDGQRFRKCTPAIKARLTDHLRTTQNILFWRPATVLT